MEILDYLRVGALRGRWLAVVVAVPVLAGALAFVLGTTDPASFVATGRVQVVTLGDTRAGGLAALDRAEVAFETVFESSELADEVVTELAPARPSALAATPTGTGLVEVSLRAASAQDAEAALAAAASGAVRSLLELERAAASSRAEAAATTLRAAEDGLAELRAALGTTEVATALDRLERSTIAVRNNLATTADPAVVAALQAELERTTAARDALGSRLVEHRRLADRLQQAQVEAEATAARLAEVDARLAALADGSSVLVSPTSTPAAQMTELALLAIVAMAAASILVLTVFALSTRRRSGETALSPVGGGVGGPGR